MRSFTPARLGIRSMTAKSSREPEIDRLGGEAFINFFLASGRFIDEVEAVRKAEGITISHYTVLWVVCVSDEREGVPMRTIAVGLTTRGSTAVSPSGDRATRPG